MIINESGMRFGEYPDSHVFYIEKSKVYEEIKNEGIKSVEFILLKNSKLLLLEAKTSAPNPKNQETPERFDEYIKDIAEKMRNSLDLFLYQLSQKEELSKTLLEVDYHGVGVTCVLVIKNHQKEWLPPVKDALSRELLKHKRMKTIWKCKIIVINEEQAVSYGLVQRQVEGNS